MAPPAPPSSRLWASRLSRRSDPTADGSESAVRAQVYGSSGQPVGGEIAVNGTTAGQQFTVDNMALGDGGFAIHYNTNAPDANGLPPNLSYVQRFDASGFKIGPEQQLNAFGGNFFALSDGNIAFVYQASGEYDFLIQLFDPGLSAIGTPFAFRGTSGFESLSGSTAIPGGIVLTYSSPFNLDGSQGAVLMQRLEFTETTSGTPLRDILTAPNGNIWIVNGGAGNDDMTGAGGDDRISGGNGNDVLRGGAGSDRLIGGAGDDVLEAGSGPRDVLSGGAGNDRLIGGTGYDALYGDAGADRFVFTADELTGPQGRLDARIVDFSRVAGDRIDLSMIDAIDGGSDDAFTFIGTAAFTGAAGEIRIAEENGQRYLHGDTNGDGQVELVVRIDGDAPIVTDFIL